MAAIKDYLHLRVVEAHHLPVFLHKLRFLAFAFPQYFILKVSPGLATLLSSWISFWIARAKPFSENCMYFSAKNLYLLNDYKDISKFANVVWFSGLIFQAGCWRVVVSFFLSQKGTLVFWKFYIVTAGLEGTFFHPLFTSFCCRRQTGVAFSTIDYRLG